MDEAEQFMSEREQDFAVFYLRNKYNKSNRRFIEYLESGFYKDDV